MPYPARRSARRKGSKREERRVKRGLQSVRPTAFEGHMGVRPVSWLAGHRPCRAFPEEESKPTRDPVASGGRAHRLQLRGQLRILDLDLSRPAPHSRLIPGELRLIGKPNTHVLAPPPPSHNKKQQPSLLRPTFWASHFAKTARTTLATANRVANHPHAERAPKPAFLHKSINFLAERAWQEAQTLVIRSPPTANDLSSHGNDPR